MRLLSVRGHYTPPRRRGGAPARTEIRQRAQSPAATIANEKTFIFLGDNNTAAGAPGRAKDSLMTPLAMLLLGALLLLALRLAAACLLSPNGGRGLLVVGLLPVALLGAALIVPTLDLEAPAQLLRLAPFGAGLLVALITRQLGYGLLAGLVVAAASS
jgi:hypothetical protein